MNERKRVGKKRGRRGRDGGSTSGTTETSSGTSDRPMTEAEAAQFLGVSPLTLRKWRCLRTHQLPFFKSRNLIRYRLRDLQGFIDQHMVVPTSLEARDSA